MIPKIFRSHFGIKTHPESLIKRKGKRQTSHSSCLLLLCFSVRQHKDVFLLWHLHPTRETARQRGQATTWLSISHSYTCSARHETVLEFEAAWVGPGWMCIIPGQKPPVWLPVSNCWRFGTKIIVLDAQMELWVYLKPCWFHFMWREPASWNIQHVSLSWFSAPSPHSQHRHFHLLPRGTLWWETRTFGQGRTYKRKCDIILSVMRNSALVQNRRSSPNARSKYSSQRISRISPDFVLSYSCVPFFIKPSVSLLISSAAIQLIFQSISKGQVLSETQLSEMISDILYWAGCGASPCSGDKSARTHIPLHEYDLYILLPPCSLCFTENLV